MTQALAFASPPLAARQDVIEAAFDSALRAGYCAQQLAHGYVQFQRQFRALTQRAAERFQERDWQGSQLDAVDRGELFDEAVGHANAMMRDEFGELALQPSFWRSVKRHYANLIDELPDNAFAKTFFNAITRRLYRAQGMALPLEFLISDQCLLEDIGEHAPLLRISYQQSMQTTLMQALKRLPLEAQWQDVAASAAQIAAYLEAQTNPVTRGAVQSVELLDAVFYRFTSAHALGRITGNGWQLPFAMALTNTDEGVVIDSVTMCEVAISELFGEGRAEFHAELDHVTAAVAYLQRLAPRVRSGALATMLGWPCKTTSSLMLI